MTYYVFCSKRHSHWAFIPQASSIVVLNNKINTALSNKRDSNRWCKVCYQQALHSYAEQRLEVIAVQWWQNWGRLQCSWYDWLRRCDWRETVVMATRVQSLPLARRRGRYSPRQHRRHAAPRCFSLSARRFYNRLLIVFSPHFGWLNY